MYNRTKSNCCGENIKQINAYKFYDKSKNYTLKLNPLNQFELYFYNLIRKHIKNNFIIDPQTNLQSIIETDTYTRNDELFRNIDFVIFEKYNYSPILAIELNGIQHKINQYNRERDKSIKSILKDARLPLLSIEIQTLKEIMYNKNKEKELSKIINEVLEDAFEIYQKFNKQSKYVAYSFKWAETKIKELEIF